MTLRPTDMLMIQTAIDEYERKFPRRPAPSAEVALSWRLGKREAKRILGQTNPTPAAGSSAKEADSLLAQQECNRFVWAWQQFWLCLQTWDLAQDGSAGAFVLWLRRVLLVGLWGVVAVAVASVFFFGALVGGLK
jgi:hypothetical protein